MVAGVIWLGAPQTSPAQTRRALRGSLPRSACSVREVSRVPLVVEGRSELYVEPTALAVSRGKLLLAGTPNYLWRRRPGDRVLLEAQDSVFGAIITRDGRARIVYAPVRANLVASVRVLGRDDGKWDVVFAEIARPRANPGDEGVAVRWWYGVFDGESWSSLEQLPTPSGVTFRLFNPSPIVRRRDTLAWTAPVITPQGLTEAVVYERRDGRWSFGFVPTYYSAAYAVLADSDTLGLIAVVVHADPKLPSDENSLFLYTQRPAWQLLRRIIHGGNEPVHAPSVVLTPEPGVLSWKTPVRTQDGGRWEARAMIGRLEERGTPWITLDSSVTTIRAVLSPTLPTRTWVTEHIDPHDPTNRTVRFIADAGESAVLLGEFPSPFLGPFAAAAPAPSEIVVAGPQPGGSVADPEVVTLLIRARVQCAAEVRRPG
jgi:hypothetical protein